MSKTADLNNLFQNSTQIVPNSKRTARICSDSGYLLPFFLRLEILWYRCMYFLARPVCIHTPTPILMYLWGLP